MKLMELWSTYLGPASDTLLDLGQGDRRWKNLYISGSINAISLLAGSTLISSSMNSVVSTISNDMVWGYSTQPSSFNEGYVGYLWLDNNRFDLVSHIYKINQVLGGTIYSSSTNGVVSNTTAEKTLIGSGIGSTKIPDFFFIEGKTIRITASGYYSTQSTPVNLNIRLRLGTGGLLDDTGGLVLLATSNQTPTGSLVNMWWRFNTDITCQVDGVNGQIIAQSVWEHQSSKVGSPVNWAMVSTGLTIDTSTDQTIKLTAQWGLGVVASDSMVCTNFVMETLN